MGTVKRGNSLYSTPNPVKSPAQPETHNKMSTSNLPNGLPFGSRFLIVSYMTPVLLCRVPLQGTGLWSHLRGQLSVSTKINSKNSRELTSSCTYLRSPLLSTHPISHLLLPINSWEQCWKFQHWNSPSHRLTACESLSYAHACRPSLPPSPIMSRNTILACTITKSPQLPTHPKWWGWLCLTMAACRDGLSHKWADASSDIKSHFNWWLGIRHIILPGYRATNHLTPSDLVD